MNTNTTLTYPKFKPGDGGTPPYLAGRTREQQVLLGALESLREGEGAHRNIVLTGPRGNGKTVLMRWFESKCEQDSALDVVWLTPAGMGNSLDDLANELAPTARWDNLKPDMVKAGIKLVEATWQLGNKSSNLSRLLTARCRQRSLVLLLDEAHTLDPAVGQVLLNVSQEVRAKAPFLLVLGGTPGLEQQFNDLDTSFWTRAQKLGIGLLDENGAREALLMPFHQHGIAMNEDVMAMVIADSQRYPYFLQCWGKALTERLREREQDSSLALREIRDDIMDEARPDVEDERIGHYEIFRRQIYKVGLQPLAAAVTEAFNEADILEEHELNAVVRSCLRVVGKPADDEAVDTQLGALAGFGYVWRPPSAKALWHAGVHSLMTHVLDVELKERWQRAAEDSPAPPS